jgi:hypothetical protein
MTKLKAFPFDAENPLGGDHEFYAPDDAVDYVEGETFEMLVEKVDRIRFGDSYRYGMLASNWVGTNTQGEINQEVYDQEKALETPIAGFWVVTERDLNLAQSVWPEDGCGNDSATYRCNASAKRILEQACIGVVNSSGFSERPTV